MRQQHRKKCASRKSSRALCFLLGSLFGLALTPSNLAAQAPDGIFGKWSDSADRKTCDMPVGSSPDEASLYQITPKGIDFYEIGCATRDVTYREGGADFELDCFKGAVAAARWFETASVRPSGSNRLTLSFTNRRPPLGRDTRTETLYRCPAEKVREEPMPKAAISQWKHNGSVVSLSERRGSLEIAYIQPRPGMFAVGVRANTTLFLGQKDGDQVEGTAYLFDSNCGPLGYEVKGQFLSGGNALVLSGLSPRMNRACDVIREVSEALRFELSSTTASLASNPVRNGVDVGGKLPYGSRGGTDLTVLSKAGIDTENAVIRAAITREDAVAYCKIQADLRTASRCLSELARYARTLKPEIRANCTTKEFTDFFGNRYAYLGANPERDKDDGESHARYLLKDMGTGEISDGTNSTGYFKNTALFSALCPRSTPIDW